MTAELPTDKIFLAVPAILRELEAAGVTSPRFELFADGSGRLILAEGKNPKVSSEQRELAISLIHSQRWEECLKCLSGGNYDSHDHDLAIHFCGGLFEEARRRGLVDKDATSAHHAP